MSERILRALMQLFAIIAKVDGVTNNGRAIVESFLKQQLNQELVEEYLQLFDEELAKHHGGDDTTKKRKKTASNSVKVLKICTAINEELAQKQKIVVLIRLIEFIYSSGEVTEQELEFVQTVSLTFNIEDEEFTRCMAFANPTKTEMPDSSHLLVINNEKKNSFERAKHIYCDSLQGEIRVMAISSVGMYVVRYLGNAELFLNGSLLSSQRVYILTQGSSIRSSKVAPIYYSDIIGQFLSDKATSRVTFVAKDLEFRFKNGKMGLHTLNFAAESGKLMGIMGGSGAGKSTLLNVLNGNESPSHGEVLINGLNLHREKDKLEGVIGFVSQDDLLIEELTVFQNLFYNAKLCFDGYSDEQITKMVIDLLNNLGLYETRDLKVGSPLEKTISGGQRKRLNIGLELIREPAVMFVDEPTSGLSSRDSENIMDLLKELALKGKLIFVVIHQPSSDIFKMFDKLMILDVGGFPIYYANPVEAVSYFKHMVHHVNADESECPTCGNVNPEQIFNIIETKVVDEYGNPTRTRKFSAKEWNQKYLTREDFTKNDLEHEHEMPQSTFRIPNKIKQLKVFITRDVLSKLTNTQYLVINLFEAPVLAFILSYLVRFWDTSAGHKTGYIFRENENLTAYLFMAVVVALFIGLTVSAEEIIRDRKILKRESFLNLSKGSYLISKITIMFILSAIQTTTFIIVGNNILGIQGMFTDYFLVLFTTSCFANMLGLNISASFNSAVTIYILIPFLIIPQLLLSGVIVKFDKLNPTITNQSVVPVAGEVMTSRWAFEALAVNQYMHNEYEENFYDYDKELSIASYKKDYWLKELEKKVTAIENELQMPHDAAKMASDVALLHHELSKELENNKDFIFNEINGIAVGKIDKAVLSRLHIALSKLNKYYMRRYNKASSKRDGIINRLEGKYIYEEGPLNERPKRKQLSDEAYKTMKEKGRLEFQHLQEQYMNTSLSNLVKNANDLTIVSEVDGELIQRKDPIFKDGPKDRLIRSHFYAPRKMFFGTYVNTFWVNIAVIWSMSIILMITLYFDALKKLLDMFEKIAFMFGKKKIEE